MIAKVITLKHSGGSKGFDPVMEYIMRAGPESGLADEIRIEAGHINIPDESLYFMPDEEREAYASAVACEMNHVEFMCRRRSAHFRGNPVYHVAINWQEGESPTPEQAKHTSEYIMKELGFAGHQAAWAIHRDTDNDHVHLVINRINPETLKVVSPPFRQDYFILDRCMREMEIEFGHARANGPYITLDTEQGPKIVRMSRAERRERGLLKEDGARISERARRAEKNIGDENSFQSWIARDPARDLKLALAKPDASWQTIHVVMDRYGITIETKGSGMVATTRLDDGRILAAKASQFGRWASRAELEKRLGPYEPRFESAISQPNPYQRQMEADLRKDKQLRPLSVSRRDPDERALKRQARADAREELANRFKAEQESVRKTRPAQRQELRARHDQERRAMLAQQRLMRGEAKLRARTSGKNPDIALSMWARQAAIEREEMQKRHAAERRAMTVKMPRTEVWRIWLEKQAAHGDEAALAALRGIRYREQRAKNRPLDGIEGEEVDPLRRRTLAALDAQIDQRRQMVIYRGRDGQEKFTDTGPRIVMHDKTDDSLEAALRLAAQKFGGKVDITGSSEFRERAARQAARLGIKVTNADLQAVVFDEQAKRQPVSINVKDFKNERPDYARASNKRIRSQQRLAGVYQSSSAGARREAPPESLASVRNLSGLGLVHHQPAQVFLQSNASDRMGSERTSDHEMRWSGTGAVEARHGQGIAGAFSTKTVDKSMPAPPNALIAKASEDVPKKPAKRPARRKDVDRGR